MAKRKNKKKLAPGGFMQYQQPIQQGLLLGSAVTQDNQALSGALSGAAAGSTLGPIGMAGGAILGGIKGIQAQKEEEEQMEMLRSRQQRMNKQIRVGAANNFAKGGKLSKSLNVLQGGGLVPVSEDAVEVQADNPSQTDSVELEDAFVDHNEIIDNKDRVFSDELKHFSGRTIAKEAKRLEKMKNDHPRFQASNKRLDEKLNELFDYQESMKNSDEISQNMAKGGKIHIKPENRGKFTAYKKRTGKTTEEALHSEDPHVRKMANFAKNAKKWKHAEGGVLRKKLSQNKKEATPGAKPIEIKGPTKLGDEMKDKRKLFPGGSLSFDLPDFKKLQEQQLALSGVGPSGTFAETPATTIGSGPTLPSERTNSINANTALNSAATFLPNIVNANLQKRLSGPPQVRLERPTTLKRVNPRAQLADARNAFNQAKETVKAGTAQAGDLAATTGSLLAKRLSAENSIYGQTQQQNIGIQNQEAGINSQINARNTERMNRFGENATEFRNKKLQLTSENVANLSGKIQAQNRESNQMSLDKLKAQILAGQYGDSGVLARMGERLKTEDPDAYADLKAKGYFKIGGTLMRGVQKLSKKNKGGKLC